MNRRSFFALAGAIPLWARSTPAQQRALPVVGFLFSGSPAVAEPLLVEFRRGLADAGYVEGRTVAIEYRWGMGRYDQLSALATDLINRKVAVIAPSAPPAALAAKAATSTIPIVFLVGDDPVRLGLVDGFSRPGGNITGASYFTTALEAKRIELLRTLLPKIGTLGVLMNQSFPGTETQLKDVELATRKLGQQTKIVYADNPRQIEEGFAALVSGGAAGVLIGADPFFFNNRDLIVRLAAQHSLPAIYQLREFVASGGLMSYGAIIKNAYRQQGYYVGRILRGERPADLPVTLATTFELVVNAKTAKALGIALPDRLVALADEVIEH